MAAFQWWWGVMKEKHISSIIHHLHTSQCHFHFNETNFSFNLGDFRMIKEKWQLHLSFKYSRYVWERCAFFWWNRNWFFAVKRIICRGLKVPWKLLNSTKMAFCYSLSYFWLFRGIRNEINNEIFVDSVKCEKTVTFSNFYKKNKYHP